ncbi:MAG TPA: substrate-binding domain-containing protein [Bacilli bacterium]
MNKIAIWLLAACCAITFFFSAYYSFKVLRQPASIAETPQTEDVDWARIALISTEINSSRWKQVLAGSQAVAQKYNMEIESLGTNRPNSDELLKSMDMAVAAKVDGIIVQGLDSPQFNQRVSHALEKGIPVFTVITDAPSSLRRTFVGPDALNEGHIIGNYIREHLHGKRVVGVVAGHQLTSSQIGRQKGLTDELAQDSKIAIYEAIPAESEIDAAKQETINLLNKHPDVQVIVGLTSEAGVGIQKAIVDRAQTGSFSIYTFDDSPDILQLVEDGVIQATLVHQPEKIGQTALELMHRWLNNIDLPLNNHYFIPIKSIKEKGGQ